MKNAISIIILMLATTPGLTEDQCAFPSDLVATPDLPFPVSPSLEPELCNCLINTVLTASNMLKGQTAKRARAQIMGNYARRLYAYGFRDEARQAFLVGAKMLPKDFLWPYMMALIEEQSDRLDLANSHVDEALRLSPDNPQVLALFARIQLRRGNASAAVLAAKAAVDIKPDLAFAWWVLSDAALQTKDLETCLAAADRALILNPEADRLHGLKSEVLHHLDRQPEADLETALSGSRTPPLQGPWIDTLHELAFDPLSNTRFGAAALRRNELRLATDLLQAALNKDSTDTSAHLYLGQTHYRSGRFSEAIPHLQIAAETHDRVEVWLQLGRALLENGESKDAADVYRLILDIEPDNKMARYRLAELAFLDGNYDRASELTTSLLDEGFGPSGHLLAASAARARGQDNKAQEVLEQALARFTKERDLIRALSRLLCTSEEDGVRDPARALQLARKLMPSPTDSEAGADQAALALALAATGDHQAASMAMGRALEALTADEITADKELTQLRTTLESKGSAGE